MKPTQIEAASRSLKIYHRVDRRVVRIASWPPACCLQVTQMGKLAAIQLIDRTLPPQLTSLRSEDLWASFTDSRPLTPLGGVEQAAPSGCIVGA